MTAKQILKFIPVLLLIVLFGSCEEENNYNGITGMIENLPELSNGYEYIAWINENGNTRQMGSISPDANGTALLAFAPLPDQIRDASSITVSIENGSGSYLEPSNSVFFTVNFNNGDQGTLTSSVLPEDMSTISGVCILDSPTTTSMSTDNTGIWYVNESIAQGLQLAVLQEGWKYEGWVMFNQIPVSTGKFSDPGMADDANPYGGNEDPYLFPGEDFNKNAPTGISFPQDLAGKTTMITIEPEPDFSDAPFGSSILETIIPNPSTVKTNITLDVVETNLPTGTVTKEKE